MVYTLHAKRHFHRVTTLLTCALYASCDKPGGSEALVDPVTVTTQDLSAATRLRLSSTPDLAIGEREPLNGIMDVATLENGALAVLAEEGSTIYYFNESGHPLRPPMRLASNTNATVLIRGAGDTLYLTLSKGRHVRIANYQSVVDTIFAPGFMLGVFNDGSIVTRQENYGRRQKGDTGIDNVPLSIFRLPRSEFTRGEAASAHELFTAKLQRHVSGAPLPWLRIPAVSVGRNTVWISPYGGPELLNVDSSGVIIARLMWEADTSIGDAEIEEWKRSLIESGEGPSPGRDVQIAESTNDHESNGAGRVVDNIITATDDTVWIMKRRIIGTYDDTWIGFTRDAGVLVLELPRSSVYEIGSDYVLIQRHRETAVFRYPLLRD
jgi:hypothetical protein